MFTSDRFSPVRWLVLAAGLLFVALVARPAAAQSTNTVIAYVAGEPQLSTLYTLLQSAGLDELLGETDTYTLLAPTNAAFAALPNDIEAALASDPTLLRQTLLNHILYGRNRTERLIAEGSVQSVLGQTLSVQQIDDVIVINDRARLEVANIRTDNGTLHIIDGVLPPQPAMFSQPLPRPQIANPVPAPPPIVDPDTDSLYNVLRRDAQYSAFVALIEQTSMVNLVNLHGPFTAFVPTNAAFAALTPETVRQLQNNTLARQVLLYHLALGRVGSAQVVAATALNTALNKPITVAGTRLNGTANIIATDVAADNGLIHQIDTVLLPPPGRFTRPAPRPIDGASDTIMNILKRDDRFEVLVSSLETAAVERLLNQAQPFTLFAPTDAAFDDLPPGTLELLLSERTMLRAVLRNHVVAGRIAPHELRTLPYVFTLANNELAVRIDGNRITVGGVTVVGTPIEASNGIIYVIDRVLVPAE